jgi:dTDP-4-dehydrorhamnose reductase
MAPREELKIVNDQVGSLPWSGAIAQCHSPITRSGSCMIQSSGIYHLTAAEQTSWYDFAKAILETNARFCADAQPTPKVLPIPTLEYPTPATRPGYSVLSSDKLNKIFALKLPAWDLQLNMAMSV